MDIALIVLLVIWIAINIYKSVVLFKKNKQLEQELSTYKDREINEKED